MMKWHVFHKFVYRYRIVGKRVISFLNSVLPRSVSRVLTNAAEKVAFKLLPSYQADTLPPIFHAWSGAYLAPILAKFGLNSPEDLYFQEACKIAELIDGERPMDIASLGSGAGHMEVQLLENLNEAGVRARLDCVDFNQSLRDRAIRLARERNLAESFRFFVEDCNNLSTDRRYDVIIVNQFFHHVEDLEAFCLAIKRQLRPDGVLLTCDVIGRNGHVLWPSVDKLVQERWKSMSPDKRFDRYFNKSTVAYVSVDHSSYSNEGIRAQDVVEVLAEHFIFDLFIVYGAVVMPFVERRIGFNFDPDNRNDLEFINRIAVSDAAAIQEMRYPASNMIAVLRLPGATSGHRYFPVKPADHIKAVTAEKSLV